MFVNINRYMYTGQTSIYRVKNPSKYKGNINNVVSRSSWERRFMVWADNSPSVISWGSEEVVVWYKSDVDGRPHRYFLDFFCEIKDKDGNIQKYLIEIKPEKFTKPPIQPQKKTKRYLEEVVQYITNESKWKAARKYCEERGMKFLIITEKALGL